MFISPHVDDETLGCGGTILKHKKNGDEIYWLIITAPSVNQPLGFSKEMVRQREGEIEKVAQLYGFLKTIQLNFPAISLDTINFNELITKIDDAIETIHPQEIYLINRSDIHSDHRITFQAVYACTKNFRKSYIRRILMYETLSETEMSPALIENVFMPNVFTDITDFMEKKLEIMSVYENDVMTDNLPRSLSAIRALAGYRGSRIGVKYAEAFMLIFEKN